MRTPRRFAALGWFGVVLMSALPPSMPERVLPEHWLVLAPVDARGRRPLRPDAVYARHLWQPRSPAPKEGEAQTGELGSEQRWEWRAADEHGAPRGEGPFAWAATELDLPSDGVWLANLQHALSLHVNGRPFVGDYYGYGQGGVPVPLRAGANSLLVGSIRGRPSLVLTRPEGALQRAPWGDVRPDLVAGESTARPLGLGLINTTTGRLFPLRLELEGDELFEPTRLDLPTGLAALEVARLAVAQRLRPGAVIPPAGGQPLVRSFVVRAGEVQLRGSVSLSVVEPGEPRLNSFVSRMDGTVQKYGVRPPAASEGLLPEAGASVGPGKDAGLVLSLHGAGVQPMNQVRAYSSRPDFWIVAPTNRSPFGFDWQDWGRTDAYEVLEDALAFSGVDRSRVYLAGHSMGGHGAWHLAALDPDGFAAVAPSAGWIDFDAYGGRPEGALAELWHAADRASETLRLIDNLAQVPCFVLHGEADDNVPVEQARSMIDALGAAGAPPRWHIEPGRGHWWDGDAAPGADCVDWPGIFELFRHARLERGPPPWRFTCVDPGIDATQGGLTVIQARRDGEPVRVQAELETLPDAGAPDGTRRVLHVTAHNLRRLAVRADVDEVVMEEPAERPADPASPSSAVLPPGGSTAGGATTGGATGIPMPSRGPLQLVWDGGWRADQGVPEDEKRPDRRGPFKRAFDHDFAFVMGTAGQPAENAELADRARALAQEWAYRANGWAPVITDRQFLEQGHEGNLILVGNADTNAAWDALLGAQAPLRARRGAIRLGQRTYLGDDLACLAVLPRSDRPDRLVGVVGDSGPDGTRLHAVAAPFTSGVGIPDYLIYDGRVLWEGDGGVLAAGWFDARWRLPVDGH